MEAIPLGDLHEVVIDDVCEVIGWELVRSLPEHLVVECVGIDLHMAADHVVHRHDCVLRHLETNGPVRAAVKEWSPLTLRH